MGLGATVAVGIGVDVGIGVMVGSGVDVEGAAVGVETVVDVGSAEARGESVVTDVGAIVGTPVGSASLVVQPRIKAETTMNTPIHILAGRLKLSMWLE